MIRTLDLFAGIGGIRLAFESAGYSTVFANDRDESCRETYDLNFDSPKMTTTDICDLSPKELPDFDLLLAGFPCQPFSIAGYRKGFDDTGRGNLFFRIAEILAEHHPLGFFLENVRHLQTHDHGRTLDIILSTLNELEYDVKIAVLNAKDHGNLPQNRERIYFVGFRKDSGYMTRFAFPPPVPLTRSVNGLLSEEVNDRFYYEGKPLYERIKETVTSSETVYQWRRKYVRENKTGVCPTLTANMGTGGHNVPIIKDRKGIRKLTPRECARLQGFPDTFRLPDIADCHLYRQIGNSVSIEVVRRIAKQIKGAYTYENIDFTPDSPEP